MTEARSLSRCESTRNRDTPSPAIQCPKVVDMSMQRDPRGLETTVLDFTEDFTGQTVVWSKRPRDVERHFGPAVRGIRRGLYVMYFRNLSEAPVYDKNRAYSRGGEGKLVLHGNGSSLKPGKFQDGLLQRRVQDADHLHRTRAEPLGSAFRECLQFILVLDLSPHEIEVVKAAERRLRREIDAILSGQLRAGSTRRGDWRHLALPVPVETLKRRTHAALVRVGRETLSG